MSNGADIFSGYSVDLIAFTKGSDDRMVEDILKECNAENVHPVYYESAVEAIRNWGHYKYTICMRFHSLVLSVLTSVPAVPIAYGQKTVNLAEECNLKQNILRWNNFQKTYFGTEMNISAEQIITNIDSLNSNYETIKKDMGTARKRLVLSANLAYAQLTKVIFK